MAKIFSGEKSGDFWRAVNRTKIDILYEYGCKAQEIEQQRDDLLAACRQAFNESHNPKVEKTLKAAIAKATTA